MSPLIHAQGLLSVCLGRAQECSPMAQDKAAQVQRRKWKMPRELSHVRLAVLDGHCRKL
jgi:hypothetical protein